MTSLLVSNDATKPTARNLFLIVVSILTIDIFRSVRFTHRHVLSKLSDTSLNAYYYALKIDSLDHESWRDVTLSKALRAMPNELATQPLFLSINDTMVEKKVKNSNSVQGSLTTPHITAPITSMGSVW